MVWPATTVCEPGETPILNVAAGAVTTSVAVAVCAATPSVPEKVSV